MQAGVKGRRMLAIGKMTRMIKHIELCLAFTCGNQIIERATHINRCCRVVIPPDQLGWPVHAMIPDPGKHVDFVFGEGGQELRMAQAVAA